MNFTVTEVFLILDMKVWENVKPSLRKKNTLKNNNINNRC